MEGRNVTRNDFDHLRDGINALSTEPMRQLFRELETKIAAADQPPAGPCQGSLGAMRDAADELDEAVEHAMNLRRRPWRTPNGG
jgi:hypothetical protein